MDFFDRLDSLKEDEPEQTDFWGRLDSLVEPEQNDTPDTTGAALLGGFKQMGTALRTTANLYMGDDQEAQELAQRETQKTPSQIKFNESIQTNMQGKDDSWWSNISGLIDAVIEQPKGAWQEVVAQAPNAIPSLVAMGTGAKVGAMSGSAVAPGVGTIIGGITGALVGLYGSSIALETGFIAQEDAAEGKPFDRAGTIERGAKKGFVIGSADALMMALTAGAGQKIFGPAMKASNKAMGKALASNGIDPLDDIAIKTAFKADPGLKKQVFEIGKEAATPLMPGKKTVAALFAGGTAGDMLSETGGEYYGHIAAGGEPDKMGAVIEGAMGGFSGAAHTAVGVSAGKAVAKAKGILADPIREADAVLKPDNVDDVIDTFNAVVDPMNDDIRKTVTDTRERDFDPTTYTEAGIDQWAMATGQPIPGSTDEATMDMRKDNDRAINREMGLLAQQSDLEDRQVSIPETDESAWLRYQNMEDAVAALERRNQAIELQNRKVDIPETDEASGFGRIESRERSAQALERRQSTPQRNVYQEQRDAERTEAEQELRARMAAFEERKGRERQSDPAMIEGKPDTGYKPFEGLDKRLDEDGIQVERGLRARPKGEPDPTMDDWANRNVAVPETNDGETAGNLQDELDVRIQRKEALKRQEIGFAKGRLREYTGRRLKAGEKEKKTALEAKIGRLESELTKIIGPQNQQKINQTRINQQMSDLESVDRDTNQTMAGKSDFLQKIDMMQNEVNTTQTKGVNQEPVNEQGETVGYGADSPKWMQDLPPYIDSKGKKQVYSRAQLNAVFNNIKTGKKLTEAQSTLFNHIERVADTYAGETGEFVAQDEANDLERRGFDLLGGQKVPVADLNEGDKFVGTVDGVKDEFEVKDTNKYGEVLLQDGISKRVDMLDDVTVEGIKRVDTEAQTEKATPTTQEGDNVENETLEQVLNGINNPKIISDAEAQEIDVLDGVKETKTKAILNLDKKIKGFKSKIKEWSEKQYKKHGGTVKVGTDEEQGDTPWRPGEKNISVDRINENRKLKNIRFFKNQVEESEKLKADIEKIFDDGTPSENEINKLFHALSGLDVLDDSRDTFKKTLLSNIQKKMDRGITQKEYDARTTDGKFDPLKVLGLGQQRQNNTPAASDTSASPGVTLPGKVDDVKFQTKLTDTGENGNIKPVTDKKGKADIPTVKNPEADGGKKSIKQLELENKNTLPKIPANKVFLNEIDRPPHDEILKADWFIENDKINQLPIEQVKISEIIPTQKNLTVSNLESTKNVARSKEDIIFLKLNGKYYVLDGHHRVANKILQGDIEISARVYDKAIQSPNQSSAPGEGAQKQSPKDKLRARRQAYKENKNADIQSRKSKIRNGRDTTKSRFQRAIAAVGDPGKAKIVRPIFAKHKALTKIGKAFGTEIILFRSTDPDTNTISGFTYKSSNQIFINLSYKGHSPIATLGHEIMHQIAAKHPDIYNTLLEEFKDNKKDYFIWNAKFKVSRELLGLDALAEDAIEEEFIGDFASDQWQKADFWEKLNKKNPGIAKRLFDAINKIITRIKAVLTRTERHILDIDKAQDALVSAMDEAMRRSGGEQNNAESNARYMFAGPESRTADKSKAFEAQQMRDNGVSRSKVWKDTGWWEIVPGSDVFSYEIDDSKVQLKPIPVEDGELLADGKLSDLVQADDLFESYPWLRGVKALVSVDPGLKSESGAYRTDEALKNLPGEPNIYVKANTEDQARSILIHEIQHSIQEHEGFASGGNPLEMRSTQKIEDQIRSSEISEALRDLKELQSDPDFYSEKREQKIKELEKEYKTVSPTALYQKLTGEAQSRLTQTRIDMTKAQRKLIPPWKTLEKMMKDEGLLQEGQKPEDVLISRDGNGMAMSEDGQRSNTDTKAFKKWFGESVVTVDGKAILNTILISNPPSFESVSDGITRDIQFSAYVGEGMPNIFILNGLSNIERQTNGGIKYPQQTKLSPDSSLTTSDNRGYFASAKSIFPEGFKLTERHVKSLVDRDMITTGKDGKVGNSIVGLDAIGVMDMLISGELSADKFFNDKSVLRDLFSVDINNFITIPKTSSLHGFVVAIPATVEKLIPVKSTLPNGVDFSAHRTSNQVFHSVSSQEIFKNFSNVSKQNPLIIGIVPHRLGEVNIETSGAFDPSNPDIRYQTEESSFDSKSKVSQEAYAINRKRKKNIKLTTWNKVRKARGEFVRGVDKYLGSISTRLGDINKSLKAKLRGMEYEISQLSKNDLEQAEALFKKTKKMTSDDMADWDYARKNSDKAMIDRLTKQYDIVKEYNTVRKALDQIRTEAIEVGYDVGEIEEYWPRVINDQEGFLRAIDRGPERPVFTDALKQKAKDMGIEVHEIPEDVRADIISNVVLGKYYGIPGPGAVKQRVFDEIPPELNEYYMDSNAALVHHIHSMRKRIAARRFFGKIPQNVAKMRSSLRTLQTRIAKLNQEMKAAQTDEEKSKIRKKRSRAIGREKEISAWLEKVGTLEDVNEQIGAYIDGLIANKEIKPEQENVVKEILQARFNERGTSGLVQAYKNFSYLDTMGSIISAVTQIGDLAWAAYEGGVITALKGAGRSLIGKSRIKKEDVGFTRIAQEFADADTLSSAVAKVFKWVGLEKMDSIGKEALLEAAFSNYKKMARKNPSKLKADIRPIFENETASVVQDLLNDDITDNVKLLVYNRVLDFQPMALSEMPQKYLTAGNGRIFYMLKSFTIKQFDVFRREVYKDLRHGNAKEKAAAMGRLVSLASLFVIANAGADELKDYILGRKTDMNDRVIDNVLRLFGISKYVTWRARTEGVGSAMARTVFPPFKFVDSAYKDTVTAGDGKGLEMVQSIPVVGKLAYWHMGRGTSKNEDLWDRRLRKEKSRLNKQYERYERADNKRKFLIENRSDIVERERLNKIQSVLNRYRSKVNKLKAMPDSKRNHEMIDKLESSRTNMIKRYFERRNQQ